MLLALWKYIISLGKSDRNDIMIPRKNEKTKTPAKRFYHIYTLPELKTFVALSGCIVEKNYYLSK